MPVADVASRLAMLEIFCFGSGMTRAVQIRIDPLTPRCSRTRVEYQGIQHFSSGGSEREACDALS
ncbi:hypothetical protein [Sphingomonas kyeonggiensis]|uniref:Uncharacterized protein n=1 Tax=Sphingomonas kyeonggiensis TaxID=1268553 RepID=A0A7W6JYA7_9SPHN|nr:hypothetical protein [Sphingomonas kyeonggiensis]MBB4100771.1 hypothetical protein [Sphingomonas kyeonggiensis]